MSPTAGPLTIRCARYVVLAVILLCVGTSTASAQNRLGGHFGVVFPLVTHVNGETVNIGDDFKVGFPMGITVRKSDAVAFDLEIVPGIDPVDDEDGPISVPLTIHPGILRSLGGSWTAGLRMAFDIGGASWGFTPLINRGFAMGGQSMFFEFVVPIRWVDDIDGDTHTVVGFGVHVGVGF